MDWLKKNFFAVASVGLPLLVVGLFLLATAIPKWTVGQPQYDLLFSVNEYNRQDQQLQLVLSSEKGVLTATAHPKHGYGPSNRLYYFDASENIVREIPITIPADIQTELAPVKPEDPDKSRSFTPEETADLRLLEGDTAPDGYVLESESRRSRGLFGELFGLGRNQPKLRVVKNGRVVGISPPANSQSRPYYGTNFIAWVEPS